MANVITPVGTTITVAAGGAANVNLITLNPAFQFAYGSPGKRLYLVSGPVSYLCDTAAGTVRRYSGYSIGNSHIASNAGLLAAAPTAAPVAADRAGCQVTSAFGP